MKLLALLVLALPLVAAEVAPKGLSDKDLQAQEFYAPGVSFDLFGSARTYDLNNARTGAGLGVNWFFANGLGIGGEALVENAAHSFVDYAQGNLLWRITSGRSALNLSAGAGYDFEHCEIFASMGGGPEFALTKLLHGFIDARAVKPIEGGDIHALFRAGVRLAF